jgi:hypothetical protein
MVNTGLTPRSTPQVTAEQWGLRQPDWVLVSQHHRRIAVVDLCRPSDVYPAQLLAAAVCGNNRRTYLYWNRSAITRNKDRQFMYSHGWLAFEA